MTRYSCPECGKIQWRGQDSKTLKSYCGDTGKDVVMIRVSKGWAWWRRLWA